MIGATGFGAWIAGRYDPLDPWRWFAALLGGRSQELLPAIIEVFRAGLPYALGVTLFFLAHELGHYVACRHHGVACSLPFFIPAPPPLHLGTLGAVIVIRSRIPTRRALFDIGIAGPLAGAAIAIPLLVVGVLGAAPGETATGPLEGEIWGDSLLSVLLKTWLRPDLGPGAPPHPCFLAGWVGLLATAMNLIPAGQLDGGHVVYSLSPAAHRIVSLAAAAFLIGVVVTSWWRWSVPSVWSLWALVTLIWGRRHPPVLESQANLGSARLVLAVCAAILLLLCFVPHPIVFAW